MQVLTVLNLIRELGKSLVLSLFCLCRSNQASFQGVYRAQPHLVNTRQIPAHLDAQRADWLEVARKSYSCR